MYITWKALSMSLGQCVCWVPQLGPVLMPACTPSVRHGSDSCWGVLLDRQGVFEGSICLASMPPLDLALQRVSCGLAVIQRGHRYSGRGR